MMDVARKLTVISNANAPVVSLTGERMMAGAAAHVKALTGGRMVAVARNLTVFVRQAPLDIRRRSSEATRRGEKDCYGSQAPILYPMGAARHPPAVK